MYASLEAAFRDEAAAYRFVEERVWPNGPVCPHCGGMDRIGKMNGKSTRTGTYKCYACRKPFTVKMGTVWEDSHVPLRLWLQAIYLLCTTKTSISIGSLHRTLGVTLITTSFMAERICTALETEEIDEEKTVETPADEIAEGSLGKPIPKARQLVGRIRARVLAERAAGQIQLNDPGVPTAMAMDRNEPRLPSPMKEGRTALASCDSATI
jgi:transposase-like protein